MPNATGCAPGAPATDPCPRCDVLLGHVPRALGKRLQELVCSSHDPERCLRGRQPPLGLVELAPQPGDLRLLARQLPDLGPRSLPGQDPGVTQSAPLADRRGVQPVLAQVRPTLAILQGHLVGGQMLDPLRRGERPPGGRTPERGPGLLIRPSSRTAIKDELVFMDSRFTPHAGGLAMNHRPQLILTRRAVAGS